jgi:hypothetical protein
MHFTKDLSSQSYAICTAADPASFAGELVVSEATIASVDDGCSKIRNALQASTAIVPAYHSPAQTTGLKVRFFPSGASPACVNNAPSLQKSKRKLETVGEDTKLATPTEEGIPKKTKKKKKKKKDQSPEA